MLAGRFFLNKLNMNLIRAFWDIFFYDYIYMIFFFSTGLIVAPERLR